MRFGLERRWAVVLLLLIAATGTGTAQNAAAPALGAPLNAAAAPQLLTDPTMGLGRPGRPTMLPDSVPSSTDSHQIALSVEYLLWRTRRDGADYAIVDPNTDVIPEGPIHSLESTPQSGFRVAAGYRPGGRPWELGLAYSFFRNRDTESLVAPAGGLLRTTQTRPGLIETADTANATSHLAYDLYDLELGRSYSIDQSLLLRAHIGVRLADIGHDWLVVYDGRDAALARVGSGFQFTGAGLMIGGETHCTLGNVLSVFGRVRGGMIVGVTESHLRETNNDSTVVDADVSQRLRQTVPVVEMALGASVRYRWLELRGGYEVANWFQLFSVPDFADDVHKGKIIPRQSNLSLDGFFVQLAVSF